MASLGICAALLMVWSSAAEEVAPVDPLACEGGKPVADARFARAYKLTGDPNLKTNEQRAAAAAAAMMDLECAARLDSSARNLAHLAQAKADVGAWLDAEEHLEHATKNPDDPYVKKSHDRLDRLLAQVRQHLGTLVISGVPDGATVGAAGRPLDSPPGVRALRVIAGKVSVMVEHPDWCRGFAEEVDVQPGTRVKVAVEAPKCEPPPIVRVVTPPLLHPPPPLAPSAWRGRILWTGVAATAAALGVGITFHVLREQRAADFNTTGNGCGEGLMDRGDPGCSEQYEGVQSAKRWAWVGYVSAAVIGAATATYFVLTPGGKARQTHAMAPFVCSPALDEPQLLCTARF